MKLRNLLALVLALALALSLCACGAKVEDELTKQTDAMFQEIQNMDDDTVQKWIEESGGDLDEFTASFSALGMDDVANEMLDILISYFQDCASQMTYKIAEVDTENLTTTVKCSYVSTQDFWRIYLENAMNLAYSGGDVPDVGEAVSQLLQDSIDQCEQETATATVTVYFEKNDNGYEVLRSSDELSDVITAGLFSGLDDLEDILADLMEGEGGSYTSGEVELPYEVMETPMGLLVKVQNNTDVQVEPWVNITYFDDQGAEVSSDSNFLDVLPAGATGLIPLSNYGHAAYASYEITATGSDGSYFYDLTSYIDAEFHDGDGEVVVDVTNTSNVEAGAVDVLVVYSKGGAPVGFNSNYITDLAAGASATALCDFPYDPATYEDLEFDSYDVYAVSYSFDEPTGSATPASEPAAPASEPTASPGGETTAAALVQGNLNLIYLNQYTQEYLDSVGLTPEQAEEQYEQGIEVETEYFANYFNILLDSCSDGIEEQIEDLYHQIYAHSKFEVGAATWDGSAYCVELTVYPIDIIQTVVNEDAEAFTTSWQTRGEAGEFDSMSDEEYETTWAQEIIDLVSARLEGIGNLEPQTITVHVEPDASGVYSINDDDFNAIDVLMIQY